MEVTIKLTGLDGVLATLQALPAEVVSKRGGPVKSALRKGAIVIRNQMKANLIAVTSNATSTGKQESTGLLAANVIASRGKPPPGENGERYLVRIKRKKYARNGKTVTTLQTAGWLEHGTSDQPAEPFARPALASKGEQAIRTVETELVKGIDAVLKKLAATNNVK